MKKIFYLMLVALLFCAVFIARKNLNGFGFLDQGISTKAEAAVEMGQNNTTYSSQDALGDAKTVVESVPPEIMKPNDGNTTKSNFEKQADGALALKIQQTLTGNPQLAGKLANIKITAVEVSVILQGTVNSEEERVNIIRQITSMAGVDSVDNQLEIESK